MALAGADAKAIAAQLQKKPASVTYFLTSEWAQEQLATWNAAVLASTAQARVDPIRRFQELVDRAIVKLTQKLDCGDDKTEYLAACRILDQAGLSIVKKVEVSEDAALRELSPEQMDYVRRTGRLPAARAVMAIECSGIEEHPDDA